VNTWDNRKVLLCPAGCGECPEVEFTGDHIRIGEAGNLAVLRKDEWNVLVDMIQSGQLSEVCPASGEAACTPDRWPPLGKSCPVIVSRART